MPTPAPLRAIAYAVPRIVHERADDGCLHYRSSETLVPHHPSLARLFRAAVERNPDGLFLAERAGGGDWHKLTYRAARPLVDALAHSLLERGLSAERPIMILSGNSIDQRSTLAGHTAGIPVAPIRLRIPRARPRQSATPDCSRPASSMSPYRPAPKPWPLST
jgi:feruloyl-CoA synthase